jgi:uncharacterized membrane protein YraQ (UPF0718 family)/YHS domain-containing protein
VSVLHGLGHGLDETFAMVWQTLWALVAGFAISGAVQAFVARGQMVRALGSHSPAAIGRASVLGAISSSCSYAASALAKTLFARGADFTSSMVFMVASTNLVVELGVVTWLLLGWPFVVAEFAGGVVMIGLLAVVLPRVIPAGALRTARAQLSTPAETTETAETAPKAGRSAIRSRTGWADAAGYTVSDLTMLRRELVVGFVVAGFASALVPNSWWAHLFVTGHGFGSALENAVIGPFIAIISFVCSVGNVPLAAALWQGGIGFGGVVSFIFADLITLPLLFIYRRYYGTRITLRLLGCFWFVMSATGLAAQGVLAATGQHISRHIVTTLHSGVELDVTSALDVVAITGLLALGWLSRQRVVGDDSPLASDPSCGMQVEKAHAAAIRVRDGQTYYFCSDGCAKRFDTAAAARRPDTIAPWSDGVSR